MKLALLVALLNEAENLEALHRRVMLVADATVHELEIVFIDDGSTDNSWEKIRTLAAQDHRVRGLRLSKNYGNHKALLAGLHHTDADAAMNLAADLQNPPEIIGEFVAKWEAGHDIVLGVRERRADSPRVRFTSALAYRIMKMLGAPAIPSGGIDLFLVDKRVIGEIRKCSGRNASIIDLIMSLGFRQARVLYRRPERVRGRSKWTFAKRLALLRDSIFGSSGRPIALIFGAGFGALALSVVGAGLGLLWPWVASSGTWLLTALSGLVLLSLGVVGEYARRACEELTGRPVFIVSEATDASESVSGRRRLESLAPTSRTA